ncbi:phospholipase A2 inhibitor NAI-like [Sceloporus undulatus]|uniref:phospholipase A2 inhibitor NAI-like n=1 Tax=Sceloporus undulatus TaxID=8520 RepID=UPI001C4AB36B|nr:phospholipase A2 inhibitor NAI-like [Sceloporus undulatus]
MMTTLVEVSSKPDYSNQKHCFIIESWPHCSNSFIMQALLGFLFFSVLFSTVTCLECESCSASAKMCTGNTVTCTADQNNCVITLTEIIKGEEKQATYSVVKSCGQTRVCNYMIKTAGDGYCITTTITCIPPRPTTTTSKPGSAASSISTASLLLGLSGLLLMKSLLE